MPLVDAAHRSLSPGRIWSLSDVINSSVSGLCALCSQLMLEQLVRRGRFNSLSDEEIVDVEGWLSVAETIANDFDMKGAHFRIATIRRQITFPMTQDELATEYRVLRETIDNEAKQHFIYRYPASRSQILSTWRSDWQPTLTSFPSAKADILASVDLWALQHSTASVFHLMRVLEHGLRALASDLGRTFDVQNWQNILDEIESEIRQQSKTLPRGASKSERLRFLSGAAKEFHFFKDGWRNYVSHSRAIYDEHQAHSVMDHVRSFMNGLSSHLSESPGS